MKATFTALAGLRNSSGPYTSMSSDKLSDGTVEIYCMPDEGLKPTTEQTAALDYIRDNPNKVRLAMFAAVEQAYGEMKEAYDFDPKDASHREWFPEVTKPEGYSRVFGVGNIFLLDTTLEGVAYTGFECGCTWDDEHGLGIVLHRDRVVAVGQADTAFSGWEAEADMKKRSTSTASEEGENAKSTSASIQSTTDPVDEIEQSIDELTGFLQETADFNAVAKEQLEKVKQGKKWWQFWR